jgi:hypothetical protein
MHLELLIQWCQPQSLRKDIARPLNSTMGESIDTAFVQVAAGFCFCVHFLNALINFLFGIGNILTQIIRKPKKIRSENFSFISYLLIKLQHHLCYKFLHVL